MEVRATASVVIVEVRAAASVVIVLYCQIGSVPPRREREDIHSHVNLRSRRDGLRYYMTVHGGGTRRGGPGSRWCPSS